MVEKDAEFVRFLQNHPAYYIIMKSKLYLRFIDVLAKQPCERDRLGTFFPEVEKQDLDMILDSLMEVGVVSRFKAGEKYIYYTNDKGKFFLQKYTATKEAFLGV